MSGDRYEPVIDVALHGEIELLADVIAAAGQVDDQLTNEQLDHFSWRKPDQVVRPARLPNNVHGYRCSTAARG